MPARSASSAQNGPSWSLWKARLVSVSRSSWAWAAAISAGVAVAEVQGRVGRRAGRGSAGPSTSVTHEPSPRDERHRQRVVGVGGVAVLLLHDAPAPPRIVGLAGRRSTGRSDRSPGSTVARRVAGATAPPTAWSSAGRRRRRRRGRRFDRGAVRAGSVVDGRRPQLQGAALDRPAGLLQLRRVDRDGSKPRAQLADRSPAPAASTTWRPSEQALSPNARASALGGDHARRGSDRRGPGGSAARTPPGSRRSSVVVEHGQRGVEVVPAGIHQLERHDRAAAEAPPPRRARADRCGSPTRRGRVAGDEQVALTLVAHRPRTARSRCRGTTPVTRPPRRAARRGGTGSPAPARRARDRRWREHEVGQAGDRVEDLHPVAEALVGGPQRLPLAPGHARGRPAGRGASTG